MQSSPSRGQLMVGWALAVLLPIGAGAAHNALTDGRAVTGGVLVLSVSLVALVGGLRAGIVAAGVATLCARYYFMSPRYSFEIDDSAQVVGLVVQAGAGVFAAGLVHLLDRARAETAAEASRVNRLRELTSALARLGPGDDLELSCAEQGLVASSAAWVEVETGDGDDVLIRRHGRAKRSTDQVISIDGEITVAARGTRPCHYRFGFDRAIDAHIPALLEAITQQCSSSLERLLFRRAELLEAREQELVTKAATLLSAAADPAAVAEAAQDLIVPNLADTATLIERGSRGAAPSDARPGEPEIRLPLVARGEVFADLIVTRQDGFDAISTALLSRFSELLAQALDRARLFEAQRETSITLQRSLLPRALLTIPGLDVAAEYIAVGEVEAGGDFYDGIRTPDGAMTLVIGDVQGKGVAAATLTALARQTLRAVAMQGRRPAEMLSDLNRALLYAQEEHLAADQGYEAMRLVTAAVVRVQPKGDGFLATISCGGHPPPIVVRADGNVARPEALGTILGLMPDPHLHEAEIELGLADTLVLYTDGVTDVHNGIDFLGEDDLARLIRNRLDLSSAAGIAEHVTTTVRAVAVRDLRDDIAVLVARVTRQRG